MLTYNKGHRPLTDLWHDPWLSVSTPVSTPKAAIGPTTLDAKALVFADVLSRETRVLNREPLEKQFPTMVEEILLLRPSTTGAEDSYAWLLDKSGVENERLPVICFATALLLNEYGNWHHGPHHQISPKLFLLEKNWWLASYQRINLPPVDLTAKACFNELNGL
ncbi:hypothetical protein F2Q68_00017963 [Brassica cretica]|uniref:Uncharacterized protein n=1 Tax=Brassica cretica TaxID=69181 RepID=A0A8S9HM82_BRACR|nr:hypothetical protein F2Q68_00017963 [Brassica cretica]